MLRRDDFSKEFGLVVQQEIKNFNDLVGNIHKLINSSSSRITDLSSSFNEKIASQDSKIKEINLKNELGFKLLREKQSSHDAAHQDTRIQLAAMQNILNDFRNDYCSYFSLSSKKTEEFISKMKEFDAHFRAIHGNLRAVEEMIFDEKEKSKKYTDTIKNEIINRPSEAQEVKQKIESKMKIDHIDFQGAMREIALLKKDIHYTIKRIEHIYVQLDRIKSGIS